MGRTVLGFFPECGGNGTGTRVKGDAMRFRTIWMAALVMACTASLAVADVFTWTQIGPTLNGEIHALVEHDSGSGSQLYIGGNFTSGVARWNGTEWAPVGSPRPTNVRALAVFDDGTGPALYAAGNIAVGGGTTNRNIAKWDGTQWRSLGTGLNGPVNTLVVHDSGNGPELYAGGNFTSAGGQPANHVARWNGSSWSPVGQGSGMNGEVTHLLSGDMGGGPTLFAAGSFTMADGHAAARVAGWSGAAWQPLGVGLPATPEAFYLSSHGDQPQIWASYYAQASMTKVWNGTDWADWNPSMWEIHDSYTQPSLGDPPTAAASSLLTIKLLGADFLIGIGYSSSGTWGCPSYPYPGPILFFHDDIQFFGAPTYGLSQYSLARLFPAASGQHSFYASGYVPGSSSPILRRILAFDQPEPPETVQFYNDSGYIFIGGNSFNDITGETDSAFNTSSVQWGPTFYNSHWNSGQTSSGKVNKTEVYGYGEIAVGIRENQSTTFVEVDAIIDLRNQYNAGSASIRMATGIPCQYNIATAFRPSPFVIWVPAESTFILSTEGTNSDADIRFTPITGRIDGDVIHPGLYAVGFSMQGTIADNQYQLRKEIRWKLVLNPCATDLDLNGVLNFFDLSRFLTLFAASDPRADFNNDGVFNFFDLAAFLAAFNAGCP